MPTGGAISAQKGYAKFVLGAVAVSLADAPTEGLNLASSPEGIMRAIIQAETQAIRWRPDGVDPDADSGFVLGAGDSMDYDGPLESLRMIRVAAGAIVHIAYFGGGSG